MTVDQVPRAAEPTYLSCGSSDSDEEDHGGHHPSTTASHAAAATAAPGKPLVPTGTAPHVVDEVDLISSDDDEGTATVAAPLAAKNQRVSFPATSRKRQAPGGDNSSV